MDRTLRAVHGCIGGVEITVHPEARRRVRKAARVCMASTGVCAALLGVALVLASLVESGVMLPVAVCAAVAGAVAWRWRR